MFANTKYLFRHSTWLVVLLTYASMSIQPDFEELRSDMVEYQIRQRGINNTAVLEAMASVERHKFVPGNVAHLAYNDYPLNIGFGQTISQPYIVAYMTEILAPKASDRVFEVGTGSGYQAAILAEICDSVYSIEVVPELAQRSAGLLKKLDYENVVVKAGDGYLGWPEKSPFDAIIVTCAPSHIPQPLKEQLAEGGKMIIPVGEKYVQELVLIVKKNGKLKQSAVLPVRFVPMVDKDGEVY